MTTRRTFLQQTGLITAGALLTPSLLQAKSGQKLGIQLYTLRNELKQNVKEVIAKVAKAGYTEVETYGYTPASKFWGLDPLAFRRLLKAHQLSAPSGHFGLDQYIGAGKGDELNAAIEAARAVGMNYIVVPHLGAALRQTASDYQHVAERLTKAGEACKKAGLQLAYHNHDFEFQQFGNTTGLEILLKETDPALVKFELDLYWVVRAGVAPLDLFKKYPGRFVLWHVKDMDKANPKLNTEVGAGTIDFKKIFGQAKLAGVKHIFVEQENFSINPFQSITQSSAYVRKQLL